METDAGTTLRETLETTYDMIDGAPIAPPNQEAPKPDRPRDEGGKFVTKETKPEPKAVAKPQAKPEQKAQPEIEPKPEPEVKRPPRPSSWSKDYWGHWEKLDPKLADYLHQRESEYLKGVSTYKSSADRAKPLIDAIAPYQPFLQQYNIAPEQFIRGLADTDRVLRFGSREDKLRAFAKFASDYEIPMQELLVQGEDGKIYFNQKYLQQQQQQKQSPGITPQEIQKQVRLAMQKAAWEQKVTDFRAAKDGSGNPLYPHVSEVEATMAGLLRSGLAKDLSDAYQAAIRLPQHSALFEAQQQQQREAEEAEKARKAQEAVRQAKAKNVSPRTQAPQAMSQGGKNGKGLREIISDSYEGIASRG